MRAGGGKDLYMAVDHGPLGGQHSHPDSMGFIAYAFARPVALDSGIGMTYSDARYVSWFRSVRAHNVVAIDDIEPEKVARWSDWRADDCLEFLRMESDAYRHALGVRHERLIISVKDVGWLIHDALEGGEDLARRRIDWLLHTPFGLEQEEPGVLHGMDNELGLLVLSAEPDELEEPVIEHKPAAMPLPEAAGLRQVDAHRQITDGWIREITSLTWRHSPAVGPVCFTIFLLPYGGPRPMARLTGCRSGWKLQVQDRPDLTIPLAGGVRPARA